MFGLFRKENGQIKSKSVAAAGSGIFTAAMVSAAVFLGSSGNTGAPMTASFEGEVLRNYLDTNKVETWCIGETQMGRLKGPYTHEYCQALFKARYSQYAAQVYSCYTDEMKRFVTPAMHNAFTDIFYNTGAKCSTSMMRNLKAGKPKDACAATLNYKFSGGKDCSVKANGCGGVWNRRVTFEKSCMAEAAQLPPGGLGL